MHKQCKFVCLKCGTRCGLPIEHDFSHSNGILGIGCMHNWQLKTMEPVKK